MHEEKKMQEKFKGVPSEIVFQILSFLNIKALRRFKCVSTYWSSIICHPDFIKEHNPCLGILLNVSPDDQSRSKKGLFYAPIHVGDYSLQHEQIQELKTETFVQRLSLPYFGYENITPVVNGLACLYTNHEASLLNISTMEITELPSSNLYLEATSIRYALGFDPLDNVYKLLKVSAIRPSNKNKSNYYRYREEEDDEEDKLVYDILTLDTSSKSTWKWRHIDGPPRNLPSFSCVEGQSYFLNGVIFWQFDYMDGGSIIACDVHQENLTIIKPPSLVPTAVFAQVEGRLALSNTHIIKDRSSHNCWVLDLWVLEDHKEYIWTKDTIYLPAEIEKYFHEATPIGNFPSGELILSCFESQKLDNSFYTYDPIKRKFTRLLIQLPRSLALARRSLFPAHMSCQFEKIT